MYNVAQKPSSARYIDLASFKQFLTNLFDAVRFASTAEALKQRAATARLAGDSQGAKVDEFRIEVSRVLEQLKVEIPSKYTELMSAQVMSALDGAIVNAKARVKAEVEADEEEFNSHLVTERTKAIRSLEAYFASSPLPVTETLLTLRLVDKEYEASLMEKCEGGIEYQFSLDAQAEEILAKPVGFGLLKKELRIPIGFAKSLVKRKSAPVFERVDQYIIKRVELSDTSLVVDLDGGEGKKLNLIHSWLNERKYVTITYTNAQGTVEVSEMETLRKHLKTKPVEAAMESILALMIEMKQRKVSISKVRLGATDVLQELNCFDLLSAVVKVMIPRFRSLINALYGNSTLVDETLTLDFVKNRIRTLGPRAEEASALLGFSNMN
ncbi:MAG: hypothetical protein OK438_01405 [Thaumarchaeota archaeon]|nr:hypothetical protein [Nitrososphaerota archaeon]